MVPVLSDLSDAKLAAAVELNTAEWIRLQGRLPWVEWHDDSDVLWAFAGNTWPRNSVVMARFTEASAPRRIREILGHHLKHKATCDWIVGPTSRPINISKHLKVQGFRCMIHCAGMACELTDLPEVSSPKDVTIALVDEPPTLYPQTTERRRKRHAGCSMMARFEPRCVWHFAATCDGRAIGETALCVGAGVAGIFDVEVLPPYRNRGIGRALVHAALRHARKLGYRAAVLGATGMGFNVYTTVGFREVCKLSFWKYGKMRQRMSGAP